VDEDADLDYAGLQIKYTGSSTVSGETFTFGRGAASTWETQVYRMTDYVDGSLTHRTKSISQSIDRLDEKMLTMEEQIDMQMATMRQQFEAMESALSELQSMQGMLSSQLGL
jgi:flagellar capping protein FliD